MLVTTIPHGRKSAKGKKKEIKEANKGEIYSFLKILGDSKRRISSRSMVSKVIGIELS